MNILHGKIESVSVQGYLSIVGIRVEHLSLSAIVIDTPETASYLKPGHAIRVVFKETEVIIGKGKRHDISLQNKLEGTVAALESGVLLSRVTVETAVGAIVSVITSRAVQQLGLEVGSGVTAMIKTNEVMLWE
jgi:molybdopterin-binding protein